MREKKSRLWVNGGALSPEFWLEQRGLVDGEITHLVREARVAPLGGSPVPEALLVTAANHVTDATCFPPRSLISVQNLVLSK